MAYFVLHNESQEGPFEADQIKVRINEGSLEWTDLCWREGWRQWRPIGSVVALAPAEAFAKAPEDPDSSYEEGLRRKHASSSWVIVLAVLLMLSVAGLAALSFLLTQSHRRVAELEDAARNRTDLERATVSKILEARAPVPGDEIKVWTTFLDPLAGTPVPASRANVLLYREDAIAETLEALRKLPPGSTSSLLDFIKEKFPSPWRETITDSDGIATFTKTPPDRYVLVVFTMKSSTDGETPYLWMAQRKIDGQPHPTLVLTEQNSAREGTSLEIIAP